MDLRRQPQAHARRLGEKHAAQVRKERAEEERESAIRAIEQAWERRSAALIFFGEAGGTSGSVSVREGESGEEDAIVSSGGEQSRCPRGSSGVDDGHGSEPAHIEATAPSAGAPVSICHNLQHLLQQPQPAGATSGRCGGSTHPAGTPCIGSASAPAGASAINCWGVASGVEGACGGMHGLGEAVGSSEVRGHVEVTDVTAGGVWLAMYGDAADHFDKIPRTSDAVGMSFAFYPFERIALRGVSRLRQLREVHFEHTEIHSLHQLHLLGALPSLTALQIAEDGNPVVTHPYFRSLTTSVLPLLRTLNGIEVTTAERAVAERQWRRCKRLYALAAISVHSVIAPILFQHAMQLVRPYTATNDMLSALAAPAPVPAPAPALVNGGARASIIAGSRETQRTARERASARESARESAFESAFESVGGVADGTAGGAASAEQASKLADGFVRRVLEHALAVDKKIVQLNTTFPRTVLTFQTRVRAEVNERTIFLRRYEAACRGDTVTESSSLAVIGKA